MEGQEIILNPEFIPVYPQLIKNGYTYLECLVYGFVRFFLSNNDKFYCTNEQIGTLLGTSEKTISLAMKKLNEGELIILDYEQKSGGGKVRFVQLNKNVNLDFTKMLTPSLQKCKGIENKVIENKKENIKKKNNLPSILELVDACMGDERVNIFQKEDVETWLEYKVNVKKQPYATVKSFIQQLVIAKRNVTMNQPKLDVTKRFSFAVNYAIAKGRDGLHWYQEVEQDYISTKQDLFNNPNL